jgi:hypothetical protein
VTRAADRDRERPVQGDHGDRDRDCERPVGGDLADADRRANARNGSVHARTIGCRPRVRVLSAQLVSPSGASARAQLTVRVRVTNRFNGPLRQKPPVLVSGTDKAVLDSGARNRADGLLATLAAGRSATGTLRFTLTTAAAQSLHTTGRGQLQIVGRTVVLKVPAP